ncbi:hypothetical protein CSUI_008700, partial [Cystoisospora suis]
MHLFNVSLPYKREEREYTARFSSAFFPVTARLSSLCFFPFI